MQRGCVLAVFVSSLACQAAPRVIYSPSPVDGGSVDTVQQCKASDGKPVVEAVNFLGVDLDGGTGVVPVPSEDPAIQIFTIIEPGTALYVRVNPCGTNPAAGPVYKAYALDDLTNPVELNSHESGQMLANPSSWWLEGLAENDDESFWNFYYQVELAGGGGDHFKVEFDLTSKGGPMRKLILCEDPLQHRCPGDPRKK